MIYACPKDPSHQSTDGDYCSVCGAKIQGAPGPLAGMDNPLPTAGADGAEVCPDCGTPRHDGARFCEVCRYNFAAHASAAPPVPVAAPPPPLADTPPAAPLSFAAPSAPSFPDAAGAAWTNAPDPAPAAPPTSPAFASAPALPLNQPAPPAAPPSSPKANLANPANRENLTNSANLANGPTLTTQPDTAALPPGWELRVIVDASLYADPDPNAPAPVGEPERVFALDLAEMLIGRRSDRRDIHPEIPLNDPGVSHRHAKLQRQPNGGFLLLDVGSTNGTQLNGVEVQPGVRAPLHDGDDITLGCWTRITVHERQANP